MVKVLPTEFTLFESQNIFNAPAEPLCVHSSDQYVFIACEGCLIEAHDLSTNRRISYLRTIHPVSEMVYNKHGDCILSLERRNAESPATARIYFKWRAIRELEQPTRVVSMDSPRTAQKRGEGPIIDIAVDAEILELPMENVSCLAVCDVTGSIALGSERTIRIFTLQNGSPESSLTTSGYRIVTYMDIYTDMRLKKICICNNYLASISTHRVRVLKIHILSTPGGNSGDNTGVEEHPWSQFQVDSYPVRRPPRPPPKGVHDDKHFISWSPSLIWELEAKALSSKNRRQTSETTNYSSRLSSSLSVQRDDSDEEHRSTTSLLVIEDEEIERRKQEKPEEERRESETSRQSKEDKRRNKGALNRIQSDIKEERKLPIVGTITLPAITRSSKASRRDTSKHELEVLGPVEYIWGQPLSVVLHREAGEATRAWVPTMLYKRLPSSGFAYVHVLSNDNKSGPEGGGGDVKRRHTVSAGSGSSSSSSDGYHNKPKKTKGGIHSVQLVPTFNGDGVDRKLVGMSCVFANRAKGYIYDVFTRTKLVTSLAFMTRCQTVSYDGQFLHALSTDSESVDSYTCRISASVLTNRPFVSGHIDTNTPQWMQQPCPSSSLELTLISSNKFLGCMSLTSSLNHLLVFCKDTSALDTMNTNPTEKQSFLQSLSLRRPKVVNPIAWNVYVLKKRAVTDMCEQFCESAKTLGEGAPPVLQHHLSEAHLLLRALVIGEHSTMGMTHQLSDNCFELADSFCLHSIDKTTVKNAAGYFVLSGRPIKDVIRHIQENYAEAPTTTPFNILLSYLNLVLFNADNKSVYLQDLRLLANEIVELFAKFDSDRLGELVLHSWLEGYSEERTLDLCNLILSNPSLNAKVKNVTNIAILYMLCKLDRRDKAYDVLKGIPEDYILVWAQEYPYFLLDKDNSLVTSMGQIIMSKLPKVFLTFVCYLLEEQSVSLDSVSIALKVSDDTSLSGRNILKTILESILNKELVIKNESDDVIQHKAAVLLCKELFYFIVNDISPKTQSFIQFGSCYSWLNNLPPFNSTTRSTPVEYSSDNVLYTSPSSETNLQNVTELQSLLCGDYMTENIAIDMNELLLSCDNSDTVTPWLQLLLWPYLDKLILATDLLLDKHPLVLVEFCQCFYKMKLNLWRELLSDVSRRIKTGSISVERMNEITQVYKDSLMHIVTITSPAEFFELLPPNGSIQFFLPMIERCCKLYKAKGIVTQLQTDVANMTA